MKHNTLFFYKTALQLIKTTLPALNLIYLRMHLFFCSYQENKSLLIKNSKWSHEDNYTNRWIYRYSFPDPICVPAYVNVSLFYVTGIYNRNFYFLSIYVIDFPACVHLLLSCNFYIPENKTKVGNGKPACAILLPIFI